MMKLKVEVTIVESQSINTGESFFSNLISYNKSKESPVLTLEMSVDSKLDLIAAIIEVAEKDNEPTLTVTKVDLENKEVQLANKTIPCEDLKYEPPK